MRRKTYKKGILIIAAFALIIAGLAVILYPYACQHLYKQQAKQVIREYEDRMAAYAEAESDDAWEWLYEMMVQYNKELYESNQSELTDAFSYQQVDFSLKQFGFDEEMIGYLTVPKMNIELPIYLGANKANLAKGAAHLTYTSLPVGGVNTNSVFAAHRGMSTAAMFRDIEKLEIGDEITITNFRETLLYRVAEIKIIAPTDTDEILIQPGRDLVTLITCHPYRHNYQRYVVRCERVNQETGDGTMS